MTRHFGLTSNRSVPSTQRAPTDPHGANTHPNNILSFPSADSQRKPTGSGLGPSPSYYLGSGPPVPWAAEHPFLQTCLDVGAVFMAGLFVCVTGLGIAVAIVILLTAL